MTPKFDKIGKHHCSCYDWVNHANHCQVPGDSIRSIIRWILKNSILRSTHPGRPLAAKNRLNNQEWLCLRLMVSLFLFSLGQFKNRIHFVVGRFRYFLDFLNFSIQFHSQESTKFLQSQTLFWECPGFFHSFFLWVNIFMAHPCVYRSPAEVLHYLHLKKIPTDILIKAPYKRE